MLAIQESVNKALIYVSQYVATALDAAADIYVKFTNFLTYTGDLMYGSMMNLAYLSTTYSDRFTAAAVDAKLAGMGYRIERNPDGSYKKDENDVYVITNFWGEKSTEVTAAEENLAAEREADAQHRTELQTELDGIDDEIARLETEIQTSKDNVDTYEDLIDEEQYKIDHKWDDWRWLPWNHGAAADIRRNAEAEQTRLRGLIEDENTNRTELESQLAELQARKAAIEAELKIPTDFSDAEAALSQAMSLDNAMIKAAVHFALDGEVPAALQGTVVEQLQSNGTMGQLQQFGIDSYSFFGNCFINLDGNVVINNVSVTDSLSGVVGNIEGLVMDTSVLTNYQLVYDVSSGGFSAKLPDGMGGIGSARIMSGDNSVAMGSIEFEMQCSDGNAVATGNAEFYFDGGSYRQSTGSNGGDEQPTGDQPGDGPSGPVNVNTEGYITVGPDYVSLEGKGAILSIRNNQPVICGIGATAWSGSQFYVDETVGSVRTNGEYVFTGTGWQQSLESSYFEYVDVKPEKLQTALDTYLADNNFTVSETSSPIDFSGPQYGQIPANIFEAGIVASNNNLILHANNSTLTDGTIARDGTLRFTYSIDNGFACYAVGDVNTGANLPTGYTASSDISATFTDGEQIYFNAVIAKSGVTLYGNVTWNDKNVSVAVKGVERDGVYLLELQGNGNSVSVDLGNGDVR